MAVQKKLVELVIASGDSRADHVDVVRMTDGRVYLVARQDSCFHTPGLSERSMEVFDIAMNAFADFDYGKTTLN